MITETEAYKGRKFTCDNCGYVVSSDAMSDFDVDDFVWYMGDVKCWNLDITIWTVLME